MTTQTMPQKSGLALIRDLEAQELAEADQVDAEFQAIVRDVMAGNADQVRSRLRAIGKTLAECNAAVTLADEDRELAGYDAAVNAVGEQMHQLRSNHAAIVQPLTAKVAELQQQIKQHDRELEQGLTSLDDSRATPASYANQIRERRASKRKVDPDLRRQRQELLAEENALEKNRRDLTELISLCRTNAAIEREHASRDSTSQRDGEACMERANTIDRRRAELEQELVWLKEKAAPLEQRSRELRDLGA